jgi:uroporphyrinogen-III synthase
VLAEEASAILESALQDGGAQVTVAVAYKNRIPDGSMAAITQLFREPSVYPDAVTFTSASTAHNLVALLEAARMTLPDKVARASIGPITSRAMVELGLPPHIEAAEATIPALVEAVVAGLQKRTTENTE